MAYFDVLDRAGPPDTPPPVAADHVRRDPGVVARHWWERIPYDQSARRRVRPPPGPPAAWSARRLRSILLGRPHTVVVDVPYRRDEPGKFGIGEAETGLPTDEQAAAKPGGPCRR